MWDGFNKRKFPRVHLSCEVVIQPQGKEKALKTWTENVGMGGVCVMLNEPIQRFDHCKISLELKDDEPPVHCQGRSVWVIPSHDLKSSKTAYDTGIEFMGIDEHTRRRLHAFLKNPKKG